MYPQIQIYTDGNTDPVEYQLLSVDFELAEELYEPKTPTNNGIALVAAFGAIEGREPKSIREVRAWARERKVQTIVGKAPAPTPTDQLEGS